MMKGTRRRGPPRWPPGRLPWSTLALGVLALVALMAVLRRDASPARVAERITRRLAPAAAAPDLPGQWGLADMGPVSAPATDLTPEQQREVDQLLSLGYVGGAQPRPAHTGVTVHVPALAGDNLLFYVSGHAPEALLMTRAGEVLHRWRSDYRDVMATAPDAFLPPQKNGATGCWRRARLLDDGGILAIFEGHGLVRLDRDSRLVWAYSGHCHHDLDLDDEGRIWVLTREAGLSPRLGGDEPVLLDYFTVLDAQGRPVRRISLLAALESSSYASLLERAPRGGDVFHTNALEILDGSLERLSPIFRKGNILTSIRELDTIAILDPQQEKIVWALTGTWAKQHQPTLLPSGRILLFDNLGNHGRSRVLEVDPFTQEIAWSYADGPRHSLYSHTCGANQRLDDGNTLIIESDNGRAIEVTPDGLIAWEFRNPRRAGSRGELIAAILDMVALPTGYAPAWLGGDQVARR
jgi:hypothetical protein